MWSFREASRSESSPAVAEAVCTTVPPQQRREAVELYRLNPTGWRNARSRGDRLAQQVPPQTPAHGNSVNLGDLVPHSSGQNLPQRYKGLSRLVAPSKARNRWRGKGGETRCTFSRFTGVPPPNSYSSTMHCDGQKTRVSAGKRRAARKASPRALAVQEKSRDHVPRWVESNQSVAQEKPPRWESAAVIRHTWKVSSFCWRSWYQTWNSRSIRGKPPGLSSG